MYPKPLADQEMKPCNPESLWDHPDLSTLGNLWMGRSCPTAMSHAQPEAWAAPCAHSPLQGREAENSCLCIMQHPFPFETCSAFHSPPICVKDTINCLVIQAQSISHLPNTHFPFNQLSDPGKLTSHVEPTPSLPPDASVQARRKHKQKHTACCEALY